MRTQHIEVLNIQRAPTSRKIIINLAIIIEKEHSFLGNFLTGEVVCLQLDVGWELRDCCWSGWVC
jgi:hypothetical protein